MRTNEAFLDEVIDDFFHTLVRTRPWEKTRFEQTLAQLKDWLANQHSEPPILDAITPALLDSYIETLPRDEQETVRADIRSFCEWAALTGWLDGDPFVPSDADREGR